MPNAVLYCRVSTRRQVEEGTSLESQRDACLKHAEEKGYSVPEEYVLLEDVSGDDLDRPLLTKARELIKSGQAKALTCYSTDRLARNPIHIAIVAEECEKAKAELLFVTEPLDTSPEGQLIAYVKGYAAQMERAKILDRTVRGKRARAERGKLPHGDGGLGVFGYRYNPETGLRDVYGPEAQTMRDIYRWLVEEGLTLGAITKRLHHLGIPTRQNAPKWREGTLSRMIRSPRYKGITHRFGGTVSLPNATPALVSDDVWEAAQQRLQRNSAFAQRNTRRQYLLSGFIWCGECDRRIRAHCASRHGPRYYDCRGSDYCNYYPGEPCQLKAIRADAAEEAVWGKVAEVLQHPELVLAELERLSQEDSRLVIEERLVENQGRLKSLRGREHRLIVQFEYGEIDEPYLRTRMAGVKAQQHEFEDERVRLLKQKDEMPSLETARAGLSQLLGRIGANLEAFTYEDKRLALEALQARITVALGGQLDLRLAIPIELQTSRSLQVKQQPCVELSYRL